MKTGFGQTTLSGHVDKTTGAAILFAPDDRDEIWIPRRVCLDGDAVEEGDEDIIVADWRLEQEGLL